MEYEDEKERKRVVLHNLQCAEDTLKEADVLATNELWRGCANRLYYAAYYITTALLVKNDHYSKTHSGTKNLFNLYFIKTGILTSKESYLYVQLFNNRQEGDYGSSVSNTKENIFPMIEPTKQFIETVKKLIQTE